MQGERISTDANGNLHFTDVGQYGCDAQGVWFCSLPMRSLFTGNIIVGSLADHSIVEFEDGSISANPSISHEEHGQITWHGWLIKGEWQ